MSDEHCPACGAAVAGGRAGCQALFDAISAAAYGDVRLAAVQRLAHDTYCMQHVETYCRSAKSYAAHLMGLCCGLEYRGDPLIYAAIQRWLNGSVGIKKPGLLDYLGYLTVLEVHESLNMPDYANQVRHWATNVWEAYLPQQDFARLWLQAALRSA